MRPLKSLTMDQVIQDLRKKFETFPDPRAPEEVRYGMADTRMSGFSMMFFQHRSVLNFQRKMVKAQQRCNLQTIFKIRAVPSDTQMRTILDGVPTEPLRAILPRGFEKIRRAGWAAEFKTGVPIKVGFKVPYSKTEEYYTAALDGVQYFHSTSIQCPGCLRKTTAKGEVHYSHQEFPLKFAVAGR